MMIPDLTRCTAEDIDPLMIEKKLWNIRRFQGHPGALFVRQHTHLVMRLAVRDGCSEEIEQWAFHHDDHESLIGDINGLVVNRINKETDFLLALTNHIDRCICERRKLNYPSQYVRDRVHFYDKLAESLECKFGLAWPLMRDGQHPGWPVWLTESLARDLFKSVRELPNPFS